MNKLLILIYFSVLFPTWAVASGGFVGKYDSYYIGKYNWHYEMSRRDVILDGGFAYVASGIVGLEIIDLQISSNPTLEGYNILDTKGMTCNSIAKSGNYVYCTARRGSPDYSRTTFLDDFEHGVPDLSDGGGSWQGGQVSGLATIEGNEKSNVFWGDYSCKVSINENNTKAYVSADVPGGDENYIIFWIKIDTPIAVNGGFVRQTVMRENGEDCVWMSYIKQSPFQYRVDLGLCDYLGNITVVAGNEANLMFGKWYQVKVHYRINGNGSGIGVGGGKHWFRANLGDDWTSLNEEERYDLDTTGKTPDELLIGHTDNINWTRSKIYFDAAYYDNYDLSEYADEGYVAILDVSNPKNPIITSMIYTETKPSGAYIDGDMLYVPSQTRGLVVYDVSNKDNIQFVTIYNKNILNNPIDYDGHGITKKGNYVYMANGHGENNLIVFDVSDPSNPIISDMLDLPFLVNTIWDCEISGNYLYASCKAASVKKTDPVDPEVDHSGLWVVDITDPTDLFEVALVELPLAEKSNHPIVGQIGNTADTPPQMLTIDGDYCYLANGWKGIAVYDISDPENVEYLESYYQSEKSSFAGIDCKNGYCVATSNPVDDSTTGDFYIYYAWPTDVAYVAESKSGSGTGIDADNELSIAGLNAITDFEALPVTFDCQGNSFAITFNPSASGEVLNPACLSQGIFPSLFLDQSNWTVQSVVCHDSISDGITISGINNKINNCTIYGNGGYGFYISEDCTITNCIVSDNYSDDMYITPGKFVGGGYNWFESPYIAGSGDYVDGGGSTTWFASHPGFVNASNGDFHLTSESPCRDAGTDSIYLSQTWDLDSILITDTNGDAIDEMPIGALSYQSNSDSTSWWWLWWKWRVLSRYPWLWTEK